MILKSNQAGILMRVEFWDTRVQIAMGWLWNRGWVSFKYSARLLNSNFVEATLLWWFGLSSDFIVDKDFPSCKALLIFLSYSILYFIFDYTQSFGVLWVHGGEYFDSTMFISWSYFWLIYSRVNFVLRLIFSLFLRCRLMFSLLIDFKILFTLCFCITYLPSFVILVSSSKRPHSDTLFQYFLQHRMSW